MQEARYTMLSRMARHNRMTHRNQLCIGHEVYTAGNYTLIFTHIDQKLGNISGPRIFLIPYVSYRLLGTRRWYRDVMEGCEDTGSVYQQKKNRLPGWYPTKNNFLLYLYLWFCNNLPSSCLLDLRHRQARCDALRCAQMAK